MFHFHLHVVPEREGNRGVGYLRKPWYIPSVQRYEKIVEILGTQDRIIKENEQVIARLVEREQTSDEGHLIITSKEPIESDLNQIEAEAWVQMGKLFRTSVKKIEEKLDAKSLRTCIFLGKIGGLKNNTQFQIHLIPRYKTKGAEAKEVIPVPEEVLEMVRKLERISGELMKGEDKIKELEVQVEVISKRGN